MNMEILNVDSYNYESEVMSSESPVLIDFYADWCGPCKSVSPLIEEIANERKDIKVCKVNIDDAPELAEQYKVMSIPTICVVKNGKLTQKSVGNITKNQILDLLN